MTTKSTHHTEKHEEKKHDGHRKPYEAPTLTPVPTVGRIVMYRVTGAEAEAINHNRDNSGGRRYGNHVSGGDIFPMVLVRIDGELVNGRLLLDGNDHEWVQRIPQTTGDAAPGGWFWPTRG